MARRLRDTPPLLAFFCFMFAGVGLILISFALNIDSIAAPTSNGSTREVGYVAALNWSLNYAVILPSVVFGMLSTLQAVPHTLRGLATRGMLLRATLQPETNPAPLIKRWNEDSRTTKVLLAIAIALALSASLGQVAHDNLIPLARHHSETVQRDWGLAALFWNVYGGAVANAVFDVLAFLLQASLFISILGFLILMIDFHSIIVYVSDANLLLVPQLNDADQRLGFGEFEDMLQKMVFTAMLAYLMCLTTRLQNIYLLSPSYNSIWDFAKTDFLGGFNSGLSGSFANLFVLRMGTFASVMVTLSALVLFIVVLVVTLGIVESGARQAQIYALGNVAAILSAQSGSPATQAEVDAALLRLRSMRVWPIRWPSLNALLLICGFAVISLVFYHLAVFTAGAIVFYLITRAFKAIRNLGNAPAGLGAGQP